ncbi:MAG: hypothetical protein IKQ43_03705 [Treponema sp.]|nr:hypothetical protein [Treponema sp.]
MGVTIMLDVSKEDVENLAQVLEYTKSEFLQNFVEKILKATDEFTKFMVNDGLEIAKVNPFSMVG